MKIIAISAREAEVAKFTTEHIAISIGTDKNIQLPPNEKRKGTLELLFDDLDTDKYSDIDFSNLLISSRKPRLFTKVMAKSILVFVEDFPETSIVINCEAGVSRSAGVAAALSKIYLGDDQNFFKTHYPNMRVYRMILNEYY
jgi:predicted protein tyrosine phosphatase